MESGGKSVPAPLRLLHEQEGEDKGDTQSCDVVVVGTGLPESIAAAALARRGIKVLHLEPSDAYGGRTWGTQKLRDVARALRDATREEIATTGAADETSGKMTFAFPPSANMSNASIAIAPEVGTIDGAGEISFSRSKSEGPFAPRSPFVSLQLDLACAPKLCLGAGDMIDALVSSDAHRYLEFKAVQNTYLWLQSSNEGSSDSPTATTTTTDASGANSGSGISPIAVPASRSDIFKTKDLGLAEKRLLMRYLKSEQDALGLQESHAGAKPGQSDQDTNATLAMAEYLSTVHGLPEKLRAIVMYGIADLDDNNTIEALGGGGRATSSAEGRQRLYKYAKSINRFGPGVGALLACNYGTGELTQAFCRLAAVHGATYVLKHAPAEALILKNATPAAKTQSSAPPTPAAIEDGGPEPPENSESVPGGSQTEHRKFEVRIPGAVPIRCSKLVVGSEAVLSHSGEPSSRGGGDGSPGAVERTSRCICVAKRRSSDDTKETISYHVFPPGVTGENAIRALCVEGNPLNMGANKDLVVVYLSSTSSGINSSPKSDLEAALSKLVSLQSLNQEHSASESKTSQDGGESLPTALLCFYYAQSSPVSASAEGEGQDHLTVVEQDVVQFGGPDASLGFSGVIRAATRCVSQLYPDFRSLFATEDAEAVDSEDESDVDYLERVLKSVQQNQEKPQDAEDA